MRRDEESDFSTLDWNTLTADQKAALRLVIIRRAHRLRSRYVLAMLVGVGARIVGTLRGMRAFLTRLHDAYVERRAIARLHALDDGALKDIGIRRSEIESVVHGYDTDKTRKRRNDRFAA